MKSDLFLKLFPVPRYLSMPAVGFDVSDQSVKFIELLKVDNKIVVGKFGSSDIPAGAIEDGKIKDSKQVVEIFKEIVVKNKLNYIFASLPEEQTYTFLLELPFMKQEEVRGSIELQLEEYVPIPPDNCVFDYEMIKPRSASNNFEFGVSVLPKDLAENYYQLFTESGLKPLAFETESQALVRALIDPGDDNTYMIVDIGKIHTGFSIVSVGQIIFTSVINFGGNNLTKGLEKNLNLNKEEASKLKESKGLSRAVKDKDIFLSLIPSVSVLKDEISLRLDYWHGHRKTDGPLENIKKVILCGGQANLAGLRDYLEIQLGVPVVLGNPWKNVLSTNQEIPVLTAEQSIGYATAIGLALRNFK